MPVLIYNELHFLIDNCTLEKISSYLNVIATRNKYNQYSKEFLKLAETAEAGFQMFIICSVLMKQTH
mgnify:CR=1 FL=1